MKNKLKQFIDDNFWHEHKEAGWYTESDLIKACEITRELCEEAFKTSILSSSLAKLRSESFDTEKELKERLDKIFNDL